MNSLLQVAYLLGLAQVLRFLRFIKIGELEIYFYLIKKLFCFLDTTVEVEKGEVNGAIHIQDMSDGFSRGLK